MNHNDLHMPARRTFLKLAGAAGLHWLTPVGQLLAEQAQLAGKREPAKSVILLWLAGGPSQLETFDPHPGTDIAAGTEAVDTAVKGVQLAKGYERLAEKLGAVTLIRSMVGKEGDHERGQYLMKTGWRPDTTITHPSIGAVCCHELPAGATEIPRHISIVPNQWPARGGYLGAEFDAFKTGDPKDKVPDVNATVPGDRDRQRIADLDVVEDAFARGRRSRIVSARKAVFQGAGAMMSSEQLKAFDVSGEPSKLRAEYGDTPFGRGCLAARRLIEVGVRCVEVTLDGWDTHANNHSFHSANAAVLDPAFAALLGDLRQRGLLDKTVVVCAGEFGRTPRVNRVGGRDHWPLGYSIGLAGGGLRGGQVLGATDPAGTKPPENPQTIADVHATVLSALGLDPARELQTPIGRPLKLSEGRPIKALLA